MIFSISLQSGIHLKDLISLHTAYLDKHDNDMINFRKMAKLSVIFQNIIDLQNSVPPVQENRDICKLLQVIIIYERRIEYKSLIVV